MGGKQEEASGFRFHHVLMWVWSNVLIKMFVHTILGYGAHDLKGEILKHAISVINMFFFALLVKVTKGGAYNPLTILSGAISGDLTKFPLLVLEFLLSITSGF
ncbi:hypothetical protein HAX54_003629 [Datura stramonium]|uniref:Aquaporin SIP2-1 n=1 Tax=Datura stramonium TaxID=4076 RepID=A0ABS8WX89_DATST|nr:hypothetical protein [Datura stramonium]